MALPSPTKVSGNHNAIFEAYYRQIDPKGNGAIPAMEAAKFLKKSALSDVVLSRIWDLSDPNGKGALDKAGFFVALKLVSLAQSGQTINMANILLESVNAPRVGDVPKMIPQKIQTVPATSTNWSMKPMDRLKYENLFESLNPVNGLLAGNNVKRVLLDSKLPMETLGRIWDLADQDKDGNLDKHEFIVAMHLVYQTLEKRSVPDTLPVELHKSTQPIPRAPSGDGFADGGFVANFPKDIAPPPIPPMPIAVPAPIAHIPSSMPSTMPSTMPLISTEPIIPQSAEMSITDEWVVTAADLIRFEGLFRESDRDRDGLVSGLEVKNVFLQSGVPQNCLAHIWALCDTNQSGKLTLEQFALAMWMVERKRINIEPPEALASNMIPPSLRGTVRGIAVISQEQKTVYANPELEMISQEIEQLAKERHMLESDIAQKEADIRIKSGEVRSLQSELDTLTATLKQLENQKREAQKRLDDLKNQKNIFDAALYQIANELHAARLQVNKIRDQCQKQEGTINEQEGELNAKRSELQKLKDEESALEKDYDANRKELDNLTKQLSDTQLQISQVRAMVTQLLETQRQMTDALLLCRAAIEANDAAILSDYSLAIEPDFSEARRALEIKMEFPLEEKPLNENANVISGFANANNFSISTNGFGPTSAFNGSNTEPRMSTSTFDDDFNSASVGFEDAFAGSAFPTARGSSTLGDPFGDKKRDNTAVSPVPPGKDDFGSDPFAILHAPTGTGQVLSPNPQQQKSGPPPRPESPSPALPPKKSKQPPPRPAPPRPTQGPTRPAPPTDGFGSTTGVGGFADFADFDNKQPFLPPPLPLPHLINNTRTTLNTSNTNKTKHNNSTFKVETTTNSITKSEHLSITLNQNNPSATTNVKSIKAMDLSVTKPEIPVPKDFSDDPFKDYRYEDPFNIQDPFAEDNDDTIDDMSSEDPFSEDSKNATTTSQNNLQQSKDYIDNFNVTPVPSPIHISTEKSFQGLTSAPLGVIDDQFANFDAFVTLNNAHSDTTKSINSNDTIQKSNITNDFEKTTNSSTDFFDAFNDSFKNFGETNFKPTNAALAFSGNKLAEFQMPSPPISAKSAEIFDEVNANNFEDDFFKFNNNTPANNNNENGNFAKFDLFPQDNCIASNLNTVENLQNLKRSENQKIINKIELVSGTLSTDDFSKTTSFDADLEEALKRSMSDQ